MPGLPKVPAAERIDVDGNGKITGLFEAFETEKINDRQGPTGIARGFRRLIKA